MEEKLPEFENRQELIIADETASNMRMAMVWAKFLAILGFVMTGMLFILSILFLFKPLMFMSDYLTEEMPYAMMMAMPERLTGLIYLIMTVVMFFLYYFLFASSVKIKRAIDYGERATLLNGTVNLKYYFKMQGILAIVSLSIIVLLLIVVTIMTVSII